MLLILCSSLPTHISCARRRNQYYNYQQQYNQYGGNNNNYYQPNNQYESSNNELYLSDEYDDYGNRADLYGGFPTVEACEDSAIQVRKMEVLCDSPYTFYYGNGANRNSPLCDYGDKVTISVQFRVVADLDAYSDVFMTMAVFDPEKNLLASTEPEYLCYDYVKDYCTAYGSYKFQTQLTFVKPDSGTSKKFYPQVQMAFSTEDDYGWDLGGLNMDCPDWNPDDPSQKVDWKEQKKLTKWEKLGIKYGLLAFAIVAVLGLTMWVWGKARDRVESGETPKVKTTYFQFE